MISECRVSIVVNDGSEEKTITESFYRSVTESDEETLRKLKRSYGKIYKALGFTIVSIALV